MFLSLIQLLLFLLLQFLFLCLFLLQLLPLLLLLFQFLFLFSIQILSLFLCHRVFLLNTGLIYILPGFTPKSCRLSSFLLISYSFGNLLTTFAAVGGRSMTPPWWMKIGVSTAV